MPQPRRLATGREITLAALAVLLLGLTGSTSQVSAETLPQLPPAPASVVEALKPEQPTAAPRPPAARAVHGPRIPVVDASPRRLSSVDPGRRPVKLTSDDLGLSQRVIPVGVREDGEMELPDTVARVGWYRFGPDPSSATGTTVLAAHVDTRAEGLGPFSRLREAKKGDEVTIVDRSGRTYRYGVAGVTTLAKNKVDWSQVFDRRGHPRLVMITCGGAYDRDSGYRDNVFVTAFLLS